MARSKVAIVHPRLACGGSEAVALWTVECLKDVFDVTLVTGGPVDLQRLNAYYGTTLASSDFRILRAPAPLGLWNSDKFAALRGALIHAYCRKVAVRFDLMINTYGPCSFGEPAVQCIADFGFVREWRDVLQPELANYRRWWYGESPLRRAYLGVCDTIARSHPDVWRRNLTLANSHWTAGLLKEKFGIEAQVIYPPVSGNFPYVPWEQREDGFVCVGRVVPEKRIDAVIRILARVRQRGHGVHLHILGGVDDSPFGRTVRRLAAKNRDWVFLEGWASGRKKEALIAAHRYGIHARRNEPFGIAPAEMVAAGCVTFISTGGGQAEIVDHPALTFEHEQDAVEKIECVLLDAALQDRLRLHLLERGSKFSVEQFKAGVRRAVCSMEGPSRRPVAVSS